MKPNDLRMFLGLDRERYLDLVKKSRRNRYKKFERRTMNDHYSQLKIVKFDVYCLKCKYNKLDERLDPCNECLDYGAREGTEVPMKFEEKDK